MSGHSHCPSTISSTGIADEGVDVEIVECVGGHRCLKLALGGEVDLATVSESPVMYNSFKRDDYAVVATFVSSRNDVKIISRHSLGVSSPADLSGKRIGTVMGASSHFFLDAFLLFHGVDPAAVEVVHVSPEDMPNALSSGEVDALSVWEPFGFIAAQTLGEDVLVFPKSDIYRETFNLVCLKDICKERGDAAKRILRALERSISFIHDNERESQSIVAQKLEKSGEFIDWIWPDFEFDLTLAQSLIVTLENEAEWAIYKELVDGATPPNYLDFIYPSLLAEVNPDSVTITH